MGFRLKKPQQPPKPPRTQVKGMITKALAGHSLDRMMDLAVACIYSGLFAEAQALIDRMKRKAPLDPRVKAYQVACRWLQGDICSPEGWKENDANRTMWGDKKRPLYPQPRWTGEPIPGKTLLLWGDTPGLGDWVMLSRLFPALKAQSQARVWVQTPPGMAALLSGLPGPDQYLEPPFPEEGVDQQITIDRLPQVVHLTPAIMARVPYLYAAPEAVERWRPRFADKTVLHVGLHWRADAKHINGTMRTVELSELAPIFDLPVRFYSLQYDGRDELKAFPQFNIVDLGNVDSPGARFMETAGIMRHLNLMLCVDSSLSHLAGALNVPTKLLLSFPYDPRWGLSSETLWYPRHRLKRSLQFDHRPDDWTQLVLDLRTELLWMVESRN